MQTICSKCHRLISGATHPYLIECPGCGSLENIPVYGGSTAELAGNSNFSKFNAKLINKQGWEKLIYINPPYPPVWQTVTAKLTEYSNLDQGFHPSMTMNAGTYEITIFEFISHDPDGRLCYREIESITESEPVSLKEKTDLLLATGRRFKNME